MDEKKQSKQKREEKEIIRMARKYLEKKDYARTKKIKDQKEKKQVINYLIQKKILKDQEEIEKVMNSNPRRINDWEGFLLKMIKLKTRKNIIEQRMTSQNLKKIHELIKQLKKEIK